MELPFDGDDDELDESDLSEVGAAGEGLVLEGEADVFTAALLPLTLTS